MPRPLRPPVDDAPPPTLVVYSRHDCHLCDVALEVIEGLRGAVRFELEVRDVDDEPRWREAYGEQVPVGFIGERKVFKYRVDPGSLRRALLSGR